MSFMRVDLNSLDKAHEILIIMIGIISAVIFQYITFLIPLYRDIMLEKNTIILKEDLLIFVLLYMRRLFVPIVLSLTFWFIEKIFNIHMIFKSILKINSWTQLSFALYFNIFSFVHLLRNPLQLPEPTLDMIFAMFCATFSLIISYFGYETELKLNIINSIHRGLLYLGIIFLNVVLLQFVDILILGIFIDC